MRPLLSTIRRVAAGLAVMLLLGIGHTAHAVPSFARQTGSECASCHVGAYGPHLTPYGIRFKLGGYTDSDDKDTKVPLSIQLLATYNKPTSGNPGLGGGKSDRRLTEADLYLAGKLFTHVGSYVRIQHVEGPTVSETTSLDDMDIRYASETTLAGKPLVWGVSVNNNPGVQDPLDVLPAWGFGAAGPGRDAATGTLDGTLLNRFQGGLAHRVLGAGAYGYFDDHWYGELSTYRSLTPRTQTRLGLPEAVAGGDVGDPGKLSDTVYWRLAYLHDLKTAFFSIGLVGLNTKLQPGPARTGPSNKVNDLGADVSVEYLGNRDHVAQLRANVIREKRDYGSTVVGVPFPPFALPGAARGTVTEKTLAATYFYKATWGLTVARTATSANDPVRYQPYGASDTHFTYVQPMWTVFGKEDSWGAPGRNLQVGAIWIRFDKFNGSSTAIFGNSPFVPLASARDLNAWQLYAKVAF